MKIKRTQVTPYALRLRRPLPAAAGAGDARRGLMLSVVTDSGARDVGEAAPLPLPDATTLAVAFAELECAAARLVARGDWPDTPPELLQAASGAFADCTAPVRFAVESALLNACAVERGSAWHAEWGRPCLTAVRVNALAAGSPKEMTSQTRKAAAAGFTCVKLKLGELATGVAVDLVRRLAEAYPGVSWRLDVNRAWTLDAALALAQGVAGCGVAYIEEPLADPTDWLALRAGCRLPLAVDESLRMGGEPEADVWIIKPSLCGGIGTALALAQRAQVAGKQVVISSAFESGVGLRALFQVAALTHVADTAAGLGTGEWFQEDLLSVPLRIAGGVCDVGRDITFPTRLRAGGSA